MSLWLAVKKRCSSTLSSSTLSPGICGSWPAKFIIISNRVVCLYYSTCACSSSTHLNPTFCGQTCFYKLDMQGIKEYFDTTLKYVLARVSAPHEKWIIAPHNLARGRAFGEIAKTCDEPKFGTRTKDVRKVNWKFTTVTNSGTNVTRDCIKGYWVHRSWRN